MKILITKIFIIIILFNASVISCYATENDSMKLSPLDSISEKKWLPIKKKMDLMFTGGLGITTGSTFFALDRRFYYGPALALGFEIYPDASHKFSFELSNQFYINYRIHKYESSYEEGYFTLNNYWYSQYSLNLAFKLNLFQKNPRYRWSVQAGYILAFPSPSFGLNFGITGYYIVNDKLDIGLYHNFMIFLPRSSTDIGSKESIPNLLLLKFCYKVTR